MHLWSLTRTKGEFQSLISKNTLQLVRRETDGFAVFLGADSFRQSYDDASVKSLRPPNSSVKRMFDRVHAAPDRGSFWNARGQRRGRGRSSYRKMTQGPGPKYSGYAIAPASYLPIAQVQ